MLRNIITINQIKIPLIIAQMIIKRIIKIRECKKLDLLFDSSKSGLNYSKYLQSNSKKYYNN
jgi:hypothetical protein